MIKARTETIYRRKGLFGLKVVPEPFMAGRHDSKQQTWWPEPEPWHFHVEWQAEGVE